MTSTQQPTAQEIAKVWGNLPYETDAEEFPHRDQYNADRHDVLIEACKIATHEAKTDERRITFRLEEANFKRRKENKESITEAGKILTDLVVQIEVQLSKHYFRRNRLLELIGYHGCWGVHYPCGEFAEAVKCAEMMGEYSAKRTARAARDIAYLRVCAAIERKVGYTAMEDCIEEFENASEVAETENPSLHEKSNGIYNRLMFSALGARPWRDTDTEDLFYLVSYVHNCAVDPKGFGPPALVLQAYYMVEKEDILAAKALLKNGVNKNNVEVQAFAKYLETKIAYNFGNATTAANLLKDLLIFNNGIGGHLFRLAAQRQFLPL